MAEQDFNELNADSLWLIPERDKSGKHRNVYHGNFVPQIPSQLIRRFTQEGEVVLEFFSGSGTTLFECEKHNRKYIGFDINPEMVSYATTAMSDNPDYPYRLHCLDLNQREETEKAIAEDLGHFDRKDIDLFITHPPYSDIVRFTDLPGDLSHISDISVFLERLMTILETGMERLKKGGHFGIVMGDLYRNSEVVPLGFLTMDAVKKRFKVLLKGIIVKNIEGNRGKLGQNSIWRSRALRSDYYIFKHEYIFVFRKL